MKLKTKKILSTILLIILIIIPLIAICISCTGCTEASKANHNLSKQADYFDCERRITVYNAITNDTILELEGYMSISNNTANELIVTCKVGESTYKKNYIYLNQFTLYVVEDISGTHTDPYHYAMYMHTEPPIQIEGVKP